MMNNAVFSWRNVWFRRSVVALAGLTLLWMLVGFVWLPSVSVGFASEGVWASICRAAGVPAAWSPQSPDAVSPPVSTHVVLERTMAAPAPSRSVGRGATLALNCTMCHGSRGMSGSEAPNLAGQYREVIIKQLRDYQEGQRASTIMQALARNLKAQDIEDLAAYYASLPRPHRVETAPAQVPSPALVRVGAPLRNVAPCISCHGGVDQKLGAPWLEGMPRAYLVAQLNNFRSGARANDSHAQMRNMARAMTPGEIAEVAAFYAGDDAH
ncbi:c-type cytochrome [Roseateles depolymerans]|uniref:Cytochrome C n=1 Tax=Roseateles depolymerans TaxID=76731 RepID=A0A0U3MSJ3_9BURK|nr:cytochrome C [Roseateles depolymerans]REG22452.1 cytochrome c553 [Roseateles depolymerans]